VEPLYFVRGDFGDGVCNKGIEGFTCEVFMRRDQRGLSFTAGFTEMKEIIWIN
jgi:hypothetical protein